MYTLVSFELTPSGIHPYQGTSSALVCATNDINIAKFNVNFPLFILLDLVYLTELIAPCLLTFLAPVKSQYLDPSTFLPNTPSQAL